MQGSTEFLRSTRRRVPVILQSEVAECGLASLAMVASYHGHGTDLPELRRRCGISLKGANLKQLMQHAERLDLQARAVRLELAGLERLRLPAILHWNLNHFVVLVKVTRRHVLVHDPARGAQRMDHAEFSRCFTGVALELTPTAQFRPAPPPPPLRLWQLWGQVRGLGGSLAQIAGLALVIQCLAMVVPYFLQLALDQVLTANDRSLLTMLALAFAALAVFKAGAELTRAWSLMYLGSTLNLQLGTNLLRHLLRLPLDFFQKRQIGDLQSRFNALNEVRQAFTGGLVEGVIDGAMALVTLLLMVLYDGAMAAVAFGAVLLYGAARALLYPAMRHALTDGVVKRARCESQFLESLRAMLPIKTFGRESERHAAWISLQADAVNAEARTMRLQAAHQCVFALVNGLEHVLLVWIGTAAVLDARMSAGMLIAFLGYRALFAQRASTLIDKLLEFRMLGVHLTRLADIALAEPEEHVDGVGLVRERVRGQLELRNVGFRYGDDEPWLFRHVNLCVRPGECVAFSGRSGQGKTTLLKIMMGLVAPIEGEVLLDGVDIRRIGLRHYRDLCAAVLQDDHLISGSLRENISFQDAQPDEDRIRLCAHAACIADDIARMPMGYESLIGDMGTALSGGQQQRVVLARALYAAPRLLFLDEATSALDAATEHAVNTNLRTLGLTRIAVAHRRETLAAADRVIELAQWAPSEAKAA